jgi:multimeric flavodoxin WrbA
MTVCMVILRRLRGLWRRGLEDGGVDVDCVRVDAVKFDELSWHDLLVVGSPVHAWSASKPIKAFSYRLPRE